MLAKRVRIALMALEIFVVVTAVAGGIGLSVTNGLGMPLKWLQDSPFSSYLIPGLALAILVGGSSLLAAALVFVRHALAVLASLAAGFALVVFEVVEFAVVNYVSWMQPLYFGIGLLIMLLAALLRLAERHSPTAVITPATQASEEERQLTSSLK